jgi:hypothetical protein
VLKSWGRSIWLCVRGLTGAFRHPEDSERARRFGAEWERVWPGCQPVVDSFRGWERFHSLPQGKRYAETPQEYGEILRRHRAVLAAVSGGVRTEQLVVIGRDYGSRDLFTGWTRRHLPGAWPWRTWFDDENWSYFWVKAGLTEAELDRLLVATADDQTDLIMVAPGLGWIYRPYDGGGDVLAPDQVVRDVLRDRFSDWLPD